MVVRVISINERMKIDGSCLHRGKMSKEIKIAYYKNNCNPFVRFVLRSVYLLNHTKVFFQRVNNEQVDNNQQIVDMISKYQNIDTLLEDENVMSYLVQIHKDRECLCITLQKVFIYLFTKESIDINKNECLLLWIDYYGEKSAIKTKDNTTINEINKIETNTYLELFEKEKENLGEKITPSCETLLETIPCDVDTIADVGCGPGLVNRWIPYYYDVLGIDIDEKILEHCERNTCIGDVLNLPLNDKSVDMTLSMDILEHIESDKLSIAVTELQRVSKKYVYIQVPNDEILRYGVAKCPECGNVWHVNFHKNSFDLQKLRKFETDEWKICQVNYTGDVDNTERFKEVYSRIDEMGLPVYRVEGFTCPVCGTKSKKYNCNILDEWIEKSIHNTYSLPIIPKYSEIGILLCRNAQNEEYVHEQDCFAKYPVCFSNELNFCEDFFIRDNYIGDEQIPFVINSDFCKVDVGTRFSGVKGFDSFVFPFSLKNTVLHFSGKSEKKQKISVFLLSQNGEEEFKKRYSVKSGKFDLSFSIDEFDESHLVRIYHEGLILYKISSSSQARRSYNYIKNAKKKHCIIYRNGVKFLYYIPINGMAIERDEKKFFHIEKTPSKLDGCIIHSYQKKLILSHINDVLISGAFESSFREKILNSSREGLKGVLIDIASKIINGNEYVYYLLKKCKLDIVYKRIIGRR